MIVCLIATACAHAPHNSNSVRASQFLAQLDTTCDFVPEMEHPNPMLLANEFVQRASRAEFAQTETWMPGAVSCIGHEPGYDGFDIVSTYSLTPLDSAPSLKRMILRRIIIGEYSGGKFYQYSAVGIDTLLIENTPFGWRILNPVWYWATRDAANQRKWLTDTAGHKS